MKPCGLVSGMLDVLVKSGPTSGPLIVSSHVIHEPQGISPPEQFIIVPLRLVNDRITSPVFVTWIVVVPPPARESYGVPVPKAATGLLISWLRTRTTVPSGPGKDP